MWVRDLRDADAASCGGKAANLAKLIAAGLPVPDGFVIEAAAFRHVVGEIDVAADEVGHAMVEAAKRALFTQVPDEVFAEVMRRAVALGERVVVRSSATIEDTDVGAAAGVLASTRDVRPDLVEAAVRRVWMSALTPLAAEYARKRGASISVGVIVQRQVEGDLVTTYTRPPGEPTAEVMLVQRGVEIERVPRAGVAVQAERAIGAVHGADVELVGDHVVQARPIVHPVARRRVPAPRPLFGKLEADGRTWTWDIAHNPDPLSTAQTEIVDALTRAQVAPWEFAVVAGYLYTASRAKRDVTVIVTSRVMEDFELIEARLRPLVADDVLPVDEALAQYVRAYAIWANEMSAYVSAAKKRVPSTDGPRPSSIETLLRRAARDPSDTVAFDTLKLQSPAWDVAVPTYGEDFGPLNRAIARARELPPPGDGPIDLAGELAERDDLWFARMQWMVRRSLLRRGEELGIDREDIGWIPFADLARGIDAEDARRKASGAKAAARRAAQWEMPIVVGGADTAPAVREPLRGVGTGPRVTGRVVRFASLASAVAVGAGDVVVARAVTPALAVMVIGCAALVSETGGLLDHGAALARELGIPCVVGCADAWSQLADGEIVTVDGNSGTVTRI